MKWAYGITTVRERLETNFPRTLESLKRTGFDDPRIFLDDADDSGYGSFGLEVTVRSPRIRAFGNWVLAAWELWLRDPECDRYAIFQDDIIASARMREWLQACPLPQEKCYLNLYTHPFGDAQDPPPSPDFVGWYKGNQKGRGALGLVFSNRAMEHLLSTDHMVNRVKCVHKGHRSIDGGISNAMRHSGWFEYVHVPSPLQHTGVIVKSDGSLECGSVMGPAIMPISTTFRGEDFDMMSTLKGKRK